MSNKKRVGRRAGARGKKQLVLPGLFLSPHPHSFLVRVSSDGDDRMGQKLKPKKVPGPNSPKISNAEFPSLDQFECTFFAELRGRDTRALTRIFSYFKYPLKSRTWIKLPKNILAKFSYPKKIPELKVSNPNKSFDHHRHLKSGLLSARPLTLITNHERKPHAYSRKPLHQSVEIFFKNALHVVKIQFRN